MNNESALVKTIETALDRYIGGRCTAEQTLVNIGLIVAGYERSKSAAISHVTIGNEAARNIAQSVAGKSAQ